MATNKTLKIADINTNSDTQSRVKLDSQTVEEYAELIEGKVRWALGPLDVFHDGNTYFLADGFHRIMAAARVKRVSVPCRIHKGNSDDARIFGMTANDKHGLRMSKADKRSCVEWLLENRPEFSREQTAKAAGVSKRYVIQIASERNGAQDSKRCTSLPVNSSPVQTTEHVKNSLDVSTNGGITNAQKTAENTVESSVQEPEPETDYDPFVDSEPPPESDQLKQFRTQRSKTVKTVEALMRAFDDLQELSASRLHRECLSDCRRLLSTAQNWVEPN